MDSSKDLRPVDDNGFHCVKNHRFVWQPDGEDDFDTGVWENIWHCTLAMHVLSTVAVHKVSFQIHCMKHGCHSFYTVCWVLLSDSIGEVIVEQVALSNNGCN